MNTSVSKSVARSIESTGQRHHTGHANIPLKMDIGYGSLIVRHALDEVLRDAEHDAWALRY
ncbi:hypothetical protein [Microbacterium foliorum]|uniref:hypothetical protein n=1 Tax=Microbacterium foliorum TaxID=104336 RepID=UPI000A404633|nr:hypothetical protein [Microbacterium foliorum]